MSLVAARADTAQEKAAVALVHIVRAHHDLVTPFVYGVDNGGLGAVLRSQGSQACNMGGSMEVFLDDSTLREVTELPVGAHTYAVAFADCTLGGGLGGVGLHGRASAAYVRAAPDETGQNELTAQISTDGMRGWYDVTPLGDVTAHGSGALVRRWTPKGHSAAWAPARGARVNNNMSTGLAELDAGTYTVAYSWGPEARRETFADVSVVINGTRYLLNGMLEFGWRDIGRGQILVGVGEVSVTANGTEVARVFSRAGEVLGARVTGSIAAF